MTALYTTGFNAAGGLQVLSFIVCAGIIIHALQAKRSLGATRVHRRWLSSSSWRQFVLCGLLMAPVVVISFSVLLAPSPTLSTCFALGFPTWGCTPIGLTLGLPFGIFAACHWCVAQAGEIGDDVKSAAELV
ncbi:hypothetical protein B0H14DRAFT_3868399 [Mycena olivaceomarginata]|nr:hypothetical protein B0H14DRAFT_3868399 [Mycena olivaceomarginata]